MLNWGKSNTITYILAKTKAVFFSKSYQKRLNKKIIEMYIKIKIEKIKSNKKSIR